MPKSIAGACVCSMRLEFNLHHNAQCYRFLTFLSGKSKTHQIGSVDANRSMRFRWQRKLILLKHISVDKALGSMGQFRIIEIHDLASRLGICNKRNRIEISEMNNWCTVEPALRPPRLYHHLLWRPFSFDPNIKITDSFYYFWRPRYWNHLIITTRNSGPTVVALTGFAYILFYSAPSLGAKYEFGNSELIYSKLFLHKDHFTYYLQWSRS